MADITMRQGIGCDRRNDCYRYRAVPDENLQSWAQFRWDEGDCPHFLAIYARGRVMAHDWQEDK